MGKKPHFIQSMLDGKICVGTNISIADPTVTEALSFSADFLWIDAEHNALTLETVQSHLMAAKGSKATPLIRVPWNDPIIIKQMLDIGAEGIIIPMVRNAGEAKKAVEACMYPPHGIRGYGPRRPANFGREGGPDFCKKANESVIVIPQLEHIDAVNDLDNILRVPGVSAIVIGPNDLSGSLGLMGQSRHPDVIAAIEKIIKGARKANIPVGVGTGCNFEDSMMWVEKGMQWLSLASDMGLMIEAADGLFARMRKAIPSASTAKA